MAYPSGGGHTSTGGGPARGMASGGVGPPGLPSSIRGPEGQRAGQPPGDTQPGPESRPRGPEGQPARARGGRDSTARGGQPPGRYRAVIGPLYGTASGAAFHVLFGLFLPDSTAFSPFCVLVISNHFLYYLVYFLPYCTACCALWSFFVRFDNV